MRIGYNPYAYSNQSFGAIKKPPKPQTLKEAIEIGLNEARKGGKLKSWTDGKIVK